ncbi:MAG: 16S rRNA (guanine(527)-N(7))-methyltransferase RsmG [Acidobacteria bacterium]|nr:16S rRNA (guanine(527)-N(7))-methyltransferase RsmG [Acidobacteriota bacterium]
MSNQHVEQLARLLRQNPESDGLGFSVAQASLLLDYYQLVLKWNPRLHLTTLTSAESFFQRHLLEARFLANHLAIAVSSIWDLGTGLGVPGIPLAILRPDLPVTLVEASRKKTIFLEEVAVNLKLANVKVLAQRIETLAPLPENSCVVARAVEQMVQIVPVIVTLSQRASQICLLGGQELEAELRRNVQSRFVVTNILLPESQNRFLLSANRST